MNIIKKIALIILGILVSLMILEIGLQTAGFTLTTVKNWQNKKIKDPNIITVLCLGESTTDNQWPIFLKEEIKKQGVKKSIEVIDDGIAGTNTNIIVSRIQSNIEQFHPDIIITMMGINDDDDDIIKLQSHTLKIQKLLYLIKTHLVKNIHTENISMSKDDNFNIMLKKAQNFYENKEYNKAISICELLEEENENKDHILINSYYARNCFGDHQKMETYLKKFGRDFAPNIYLDILISQNRRDEIRSFFSFESEQKFNNYIYLHFDMIMCHLPSIEKLGMNDLAIKIHQTILKLDITNKYSAPKILGYMAIDSIKKHNLKQAEKLWKMQTDFLLKNAKKQTIDNYKTTAQICKDNGIKLIAMQYPVRNIKPLKKTLEEFNEVIFISNEENFKEALTNHKVKEIFNDQFGGDFGHCTDYGNTLIAENVAKHILGQVQ